MKTIKTAEPADRLDYKGELRTVDGQRFRGSPCGHHIGLGQGEFHRIDGYERLWCAIDWCIGVTALNNGQWMSRPGPESHNFTVQGRQYPSRDAALRAAVACNIRHARRRLRFDWKKAYPWWDRDLSGSHWKLTPDVAGHIIAWSLSLLGKPPIVLFVKPPEPPPAFIECAGQVQLVMNF